jgi:hypothetical protein
MSAPLVLVEWSDSRQPMPGWQMLANYAPAAPCACVSVGFLIHDGADVKALAPNIADVAADDGMQASGVIHIPTTCIRRIVALEEAEPTSFCPRQSFE